jgi:hypothetical protein
MTSAELAKIIKPATIQVLGPQEGRVVREIPRSNVTESVEGVTLRKVNSPLDMTLKKVTSPTEMTITTSVGSGGSGVEGMNEDAQIVLKIATPNQTDAAMARAAARKASSVKTQKAILEAHGLSMPELSKPVVSEPELSKPVVSEPVLSQNEDNQTVTKNNYLLMLPSDWGTLHWVKKEKFIKSLTDVNFVKYIQTVETSTALQRACKERISELEQVAAN